MKVLFSSLKWPPLFKNTWSNSKIWRKCSPNICVVRAAEKATFLLSAYDSEKEKRTLSKDDQHNMKLVYQFLNLNNCFSSQVACTLHNILLKIFVAFNISLFRYFISIEAHISMLIYVLTAKYKRHFYGCLWGRCGEGGVGWLREDTGRGNARWLTWQVPPPKRTQCLDHALIQFLYSFSRKSCWEVTLAT